MKRALPSGATGWRGCGGTWVSVAARSGSSTRPRTRTMSSRWRTTCRGRPSTGPDEVRHADITYLQTGEGWLYLAGVKDRFTCQTAGYAMGGRMTQGLTLSALSKAARARPRPPLGPGWPSTAPRTTAGCSAGTALVASMSRKGNCYDNASIGSFWGSLPAVRDPCRG